MKRNKLLISILVVGALALAAAAMIVSIRPGSRRELPPGLIFSGRGPYGEICVVDDGGLRYLVVDGAIRAAVDTSLNGESAMQYVNVIDIAREFHEGTGRALLVGIGAGSVAKHYRKSDWHVDAVEPDSLVVSVATRFFGFDPADATIVQTDGRQFISAAAGTYDNIVVDAFGSSSIPLHLLTREAFDLIASRLEPRGVLVVNVRAIGWQDVIVRSLAATLAADFANVLALPIAEPPNQLGNVILLASRDSLEMPEDLPPPDDRFSAEYDRVHAWENRFSPDTNGMPAFSDGRNPLGRMVQAINVRERALGRELFERLGADR